MSCSHSFNIDFASQYGIEEAILINHFQHWIRVNKSREKNFHDGRWWMYETHEEIASHFPYFSSDVVKRTLNSLVKQGVIIKGNFNRTPFDKTCWYAFCDEDFFVKSINSKISNERTNRLIEKDKCTSPELQIATPIPDTITNTKKEDCLCPPSGSDVKGAKSPPSFSKKEAHEEEKVSIPNARLEVKTISKQELISQAVREKKDWDLSEIQEAWDILKSQKVVNDPFHFLSGTISNLRKKKKVSEFREKTIEQQKEKSCQIQEYLKEPTREQLEKIRHRLGADSWMQVCQNPSSLPTT